MPDTEAAKPATDFIRQIVSDDLASGKHQAIVTRFPPEPNGHLHIGHAKAISIDFGVAQQFGGQCHLRFDDTNPIKEEQKYIDAIKRDVHWLGFDWGEHEYHASDYFEQLYEWAIHLIKQGKAYVCDLTAEQIRTYRGTLTEPGQHSPDRERSVEENLDLFERMKNGEFPDGSRTLRAKIDMAASNLNLRDPVMYRVLHAAHPRTGDAWCIYPMYDWAHGQSDAIEGITHSLCDLDFENHRPLYDWFVDNLPVPHKPRQIEFARGNITYMITSKRKLLQLIEEGHVDGWDDPRMPTLSGLRRRGYSPEAIRKFWETAGVAKRENNIEISLLEHTLREHLNAVAARRMAVLNPLRVVIENYPKGESEELDAVNNPGDPEAGTRKVPFSRVLYIEREDFMEDPPKKFFRLGPGREVRLRYAYFVTCTEAIKDESGEIVELRCTYDPATRGGDAPDGRKVKGTLHWVSAEHAHDATVRMYEHLFSKEDPGDVEEGETFLENVNPESLATLSGCKVEPALAEAEAGDYLQFERQGYFCVDSKDSSPEHLVFNRTITLKDTWAKMQKKGS
jgi:glutaminyl-tRNA synthetase